MNNSLDIKFDEQFFDSLQVALESLVEFSSPVKPGY